MANQYQQKIDAGELSNRKSRSSKDSTSRVPIVPQTNDLNTIQARFSPWRFLIITIGGIFLAEVLAMIFIYGFPNLPYYLQTLIDASLMVILIFPIVYSFSLRPLLLHIEKHQRMENALRQSEERFALAYRSNPAALTISRGEDGRFIEVNESFLRLSGYARNEVIGHTSDELNLYPNLGERDKLKWLLLKQGSVDSFEMTTRIKSGEIRNLSISTEATELGGEVNILAIASDITERKEVERQLRIQTTAMEAAANGIVITDCQGNIQWTNPALTQMSGYASHEILGKTMRLFKSGSHDKGYYDQMWTSILSGQVWRGETINRRKDSSLYVEEQTITPVRDENDQIRHFIAIKQDITKRKQAEAELAERNIKLQILIFAEHEQRQLADALIEAALVLNKSMKLDEVLPLILEQIKEAIPYQLANITMFDGESFYDASHQGDQRWHRGLAEIKNRFPIEDFPLVAKMRKSGQPILILDTQKESDWILVNGQEWCRSFLAVPLLAENQVIGFLNLFTDQPGFFTTGMQNRLVAFASHAAVAIQNAWLFEQVRASGDRLQSLSHRLVEIQENERLYISRELHDEVGQMLTSIMLDLHTLEMNAWQSDIVLKKVAEMEGTLNAASKSLHKVAMALRPASLDHLGLVPALRQHVESIGEKYGLRASFRSGKIQERLPANMETELYRIVQEALTNVVRHAHASQVDVILTVRADKLILIVEDDGDGFSAEKVPEAGHLGLLGIRERAEMIGGKLVIESNLGKGTTVMVEVNYVSSNIDRR